MDANLSQLMLFDFADTATGAVEFFPEVWNATQGLTSPDIAVRRESIDRLVVLDAVRLSPLVAYVVATRIFESDLDLRRRVVNILGKIFLPNETGKLTPPTVRVHLASYCSKMEQREILQLLEVAEAFPETESKVAAILNNCSQSGTILAEMMSDRRILLAMRRQAINFIGRVGFLDAIPALEKLEERLKSRANGQKSMPFALPSNSEENSLLPMVQATLTLLHEP
jgi:hypothetical protein